MSRMIDEQDGSGYKAWLGGAGKRIGADSPLVAQIRNVVVSEADEIIATAALELAAGIRALTGITVEQSRTPGESGNIIIGTFAGNADVERSFSPETVSRVKTEGYALRIHRAAGRIAIGATSASGVLYGVFHLLRLLRGEGPIEDVEQVENPANVLRMINQWDNADGSIERGYAGRSIFYHNDEITEELDRIRDYARLLASVGINSISINNVNVHRVETRFIRGRELEAVARVADVFRAYGIKLFLSVNFAAPIELGDLETADPLAPEVKAWWSRTASEIYHAIPDFGGFLVKADSENRPGPFTYGRDHADGSNMLAEALEPYGGIVIWRCFVYDCKQDWRDRSTDRARAAFDHFKPLDGRFRDNVILQIKNGPMDFQVREPVSPLFGALANTNVMIEFQITQEYTGQQRHLCYLVPQWKEALDFDTCVQEQEASVKRVVDGSMFQRPHGGFAAVSNIGDDENWTGHLLAQSNLYGYGRLAWNPELTAAGIAEEWAVLTFGGSDKLISSIVSMLLDSWGIYEAYTAPLGVGWMVNPEHHYGPNVDGYEYSKWGTYHFADCGGIGVDRTRETGTGYTGQYRGRQAEIYEDLERCPNELLLFFHHVPYTHRLHSGKTVIQHIYDTHFAGAQQAQGLRKIWEGLRSELPSELFLQVADRLSEQAEHAMEWRDIINTYFFRKSGIPDQHGRTIF